MASKMRQRLFGLLLALCTLACLLPAGAARARRADEEQARVFDDVWELVRERYYDPALRGVDWEGLGESLRPLAARARDEAEFYAVLRRLLGSLRDPHTRVFPPGESVDWRVQRFVTVGLSVREVEGVVVVTGVARDSEAARAGLKPGDAILSVDGEATATVVARRLSELGGAPSARLLAVARLFDGARDTEVAVVFRREPGGRARSARLRREVFARVPEFTLRREGGGVAVARFNLFTEGTAARFVRALRAEEGRARALVIDLRDNGGGETEAMTDIASTLLPAGAPLGRFTGRDGLALIEPRTRSSFLSAAEAPYGFRGPVVILTGPRTASAAEVFAAALREAGRARVVGETTCGCVLGIRRRHTLPDGGVLDISEMDYRTAGGLRLEGSGLAPDEEVTPTRAELRKGRDGAMERAVELLKTEVRRNRG
jgi:carboxyl-terminal processing protease